MRSILAIYLLIKKLASKSRLTFNTLVKWKIVVNLKYLQTCLMQVNRCSIDFLSLFTMLKFVYKSELVEITKLEYNEQGCNSDLAFHISFPLIHSREVRLESTFAPEFKQGNLRRHPSSGLSKPSKLS